jgi:hypothetical protein
MIGSVMQVVEVVRLYLALCTSVLRLWVAKFDKFDIYIHDNPIRLKHIVLQLLPI